MRILKARKLVQPATPAEHLPTIEKLVREQNIPRERAISDFRVLRFTESGKQAFKTAGHGLFIVGILMDAGRILTANDKTRALLKVAGGWIGGAVGGATGAAIYGSAVNFVPVLGQGTYLFLVFGGAIVGEGVAARAYDIAMHEAPPFQSIQEILQEGQSD